MVGYMPMPANFQYADVLRRGRPQHDQFDRFRLRHPSMAPGKRAKIFAPFDALRGFSEAVAAKEVQYEYRRELDDHEKEELDRRLRILRSLTYNGKAARANRVMVTVTYYMPCGDLHHEAYGYRGQYVTETGICWKIGLKTIRIGENVFLLKDIVAIESTDADGDSIFDGDWEYIPS